VHLDAPRAVGVARAKLAAAAVRADKRGRLSYDVHLEVALETAHRQGHRSSRMDNCADE
jgi:hypothetical protein